MGKEVIAEELHVVEPHPTQGVGHLGHWGRDIWGQHRIQEHLLHVHGSKMHHLVSPLNVDSYSLTLHVQGSQTH